MTAHTQTPGTGDRAPPQGVPARGARSRSNGSPCPDRRGRAPAVRTRRSGAAPWARTATYARTLPIPAGPMDGSLAAGTRPAHRPRCACPKGQGQPGVRRYGGARTAVVNARHPGPGPGSWQRLRSCEDTLARKRVRSSPGCFRGSGSRVCGARACAKMVAAARCPCHRRMGGRAGPRQEALVRAAVTATVEYGIVKQPPSASMAVPTPSSTSASLSAGSRVRVPWVGIWSSHSSRV